MNKKNIIILTVGGLIMIGLVFYGGMRFGGQGQKVNTKGSFSGQFDLQGLGMQRSVNQGGLLRTSGMGGGVSGEVIAKDDKSITVKLRDGGSKIIFYSEKTSVLKTATTSLSDVLVGGQVVISGSSDQSGNITAESIQLR